MNAADAARDIVDIYALAPMQQGMLFHTLYAPASGVYVEQMTCLLRGSLDVGAFRAAWGQVVARHAALRTAFVWEHVDTPVQVVFRGLEVPWNVLDLRHLAPHEQQVRLDDLLRVDRCRSFDLGAAPLMRLSLIALADDAVQFLWSFHHLLLDGWSVAILLNEVFECYDAARHGRAPRLAPPAPYRDYIASLSRLDTGAAQSYWRDRLAGFTEATPLPLERLSAAARVEEELFAEVERVVDDDDVCPDIAQMLRAGQLTLSTLVHGAWALLLSRFSGAGDVVFGTVVAGRPPSLSGSDRMVGLLVNTLPVRIGVDPRRCVGEWLHEIQDRQAGSSAHELVPLVDVLGWSELPRDTPLFNSIVAVENYPNDFSKFDNIHGLTVSDVRSFESTNYPLTLTVEGTNRIRCRMLFDRRHFDSATAERLLREFEFIFREALAGLTRPISSLPLLRPDERHRIVADWNNTEAAFPDDCGVHDLFTHQAQRTPEATAIIDGDRSLSYADLERRANQLANWLGKQGVTRGDRVGLFLERSTDLMVAILATLKAGAAYVPLDITYPPTRVAFMLGDAAVRLILSTSALTGRLPPSGAPVARLDELRAALDAEAVTDPPVESSPDDLAYVLYTSGSTGTPKGVTMPHRGLCNLIAWQMRASADVGVCRTLQFSPVSFDVSFQEIFATWCAGGTLVLISDETRRDPARLLAFIAREDVARLFLPFVALQQLARAFCDAAPPISLPLREVITAGEQLQVTPQIVRMFEALPDCRLHNQYGPTESHVVTAHELAGPPAFWPALPPIGRPIANVRVYVLDGEMRPVPVGAAGELFLGGVALARGYLNQPALTRDRFVPNPFAGPPDSARLYHTGDRARWRPDGQLEFLGRFDAQIKLRGYRVEPGEVEAALLAHPAVRQAVAIAHAGDDTASASHLIAYVVTSESLSDLASELRGFLAARLPDYMIPSAFVSLPSLPLTPSGKLDRRSLPEAARDVSRPHVAPRTPTEEALVQIWSQVLKLKSIGIHDDFFELGGHSLLATQVLSRLRQMFAVELPLRCLFDARTVARLAKAVETARLADQGLQSLPLRPVEREGPLPLSFAQERMWFLDQVEPGSSEYNLPVCLRITGDLRRSALEASIAAIVARHEVLRTTFGSEAGRPFQVIHASPSWPFDVIDLQSHPPGLRDDEALGLARDFARRPFDLSTGPLGRTLLITLSPREHLLALVVHHIVADGWSLGIFVHELTSFYEAHITGGSAALPLLPLQYADFAWWQRQWLEGNWLSAQLDYWKRQLKDHPPPLSLPTDRRRAAVNCPKGSSEPLRLGPGVTAAVKRLADEARATLFMTLLAAFQLLLHRLTRETDILVGTPVANRTQLELEHLVGCFINPVVLRTRFDEPSSFYNLLDRVRETSLKAFAHQELPFERVVKALESSRDLTRNPLFQVMFILQNAPLPPLRLRGLTLEPFELGGGSAAFDLLLTMWEAGGELHGLMEYRADLFDSTTIRSLLSRFELLIEGITADPRQPVSTFPLMKDDERRRLLYEWNQTGRPASEGQTVYNLFHEQVKRTPDAIAVIGVTRPPLTYRELERRVDQLTRWLVEQGVGWDARVGLMLERSEALIVTLLGVLKSGAAYVPLDPNYPPERLAWMANDAGVKLVLTHRPLMSRQPDFTMPLDSIEAQAEWRETENVDSPQTAAAPDDLAYVLYTSGSTGQPKGVEIPHRALTNFVAWAADAYELSAADRILQFASISFDASVEEIYPALSRGATIVLRTDEMLGSASLFLGRIREWGITVLDLPTSYWHALTAEMVEHQLSFPASVRLVILGGEATRPEILAAWQEHVGRGVRLLNTYGPTEVTVVSTMADLTQIARDDVLTRDVPIGRPVANVRAYVLGPDMELEPTGVAGELYLGGAGLARGYFNRLDLTAERFISDPFPEPAEASRLYRTGDCARRRADGNLEFLGRSDNQIKLRGFRIEPGEIEAVLLAHPDVRQAAVVMPEDHAPGEPRLVAFIVTGEPFPDPAGKLRAFLAARLPAHMIPSSFVSLPSLPFTPSGKLDRRALPKSTITPPIATIHTLPRTDIECTVAAIWADVLKLEHVGLHDDFFDLGGHSLLAAQLLARVESRFSTRLSLRRLFESPTVAGIVAAIQARSALGTPQSAPVDSTMLRSDAILDPSIRPTDLISPADVTDVFLTGGTGFLGMSLLAELLRDSSVVVHCLVRASSAEHALIRLRQSLERHGLWKDSFAARLVPVAGDLTRSRLGLSDEDFAQLAAEVGVIYHCGAGVSAVQPYAALRAANVCGTRELLKLACDGAPKPLHHISTLAVWASPAYVSLAEITEEADPTDCEGLDGGYTQSKWVAERLVLEARARGVPVAVYRPGLITGSSVTGVCKSDDLTLAAARLCIDLHILPQLDVPLDLIPVDYTARAIVHLARQRSSIGRAFHLFNPRPISWLQFGDWLRRMGYDLKPIEIDDLQSIASGRADPASLAALKMLFGRDRTSGSAARLDDRNTREGLGDSSITCPPVDDALLGVYLAHFTRSGLLQSPPIPSGGKP